jgi:hypothetical protein
MDDEIFKSLGRFVIRPNFDGSDDKVILGVSFNAGVFKPGFVYEIQTILGQIMIKEIGESSCKMTYKDTKGGISWCNDANQIITHGTHLLTDSEYQENIHDDRTEEEKVNDNRKEKLGDILDNKKNSYL